MAGRKRKAGSQRGRPRKTSRTSTREEIPAREEQIVGSEEEAGQDTQREARGRGRGRGRGRSRGTRDRRGVSLPCTLQEGPQLRGRDGGTFEAVQAAFEDDRGSQGRTEDRGPAEESEDNEERNRYESYDSDVEDDLSFNEAAASIHNRASGPGLGRKAVGPRLDKSRDSSDLNTSVKNLAALVKTLAEKVDALEKTNVTNNNSAQRGISQDSLIRDIPSQATSQLENEAVSGQSLVFNNVDVNHRPVLFTGGLRLGEHLPTNIKQKIWEDKFIEFSSILDPDTTDSYSLSLNNSGQPTLCLTPKKKNFLKESDWTMAFDTYVAVYVQKYPEQLQDLLTYGNTIKRMMNSGQQWWHYDKQFRVAREYSHCSWATVRVDLIMQMNSRDNQTQRQKFQEYPRIQPGYCFNYHAREKKCFKRNCSYKHNCPRCNKIHPGYQPCNSKQDTRYNSSRPNFGREQASNSN